MLVPRTTVASPLRMVPSVDLVVRAVEVDVVERAEVVEVHTARTVMTGIAVDLQSTHPLQKPLKSMLTSRSEHTKQANQSWGGATGGSEWDDEKAGEAIAQAEAKDPEATKGPDAPTDAEGNAPTSSAPVEEPEPEDNSKSYAEYLAELAAKKLNLGGTLEARKPNEGSKPDKKWAGAKEVTKAEEEDFIAARERKAGRTRERKEKVTVDIDHRFVEAPGGRGGSERGGRGGRGRGEGGFRGRGDGRGRGGEGRGRGGRGGGGEFRGSRAGGPRGGRGGEQVNLADQSAFPSLGGS